MKTTVEIQDKLLKRAQKLASAKGSTLRALIEEGLRRVLDDGNAPRPRFSLKDKSVGTRGGHDPLQSLAWDELRSEIYGPRE